MLGSDRAVDIIGVAVRIAGQRETDPLMAMALPLAAILKVPRKRRAHNFWRGRASSRSPFRRS